jgi:hypothetical protein
MMIWIGWTLEGLLGDFAGIFGRVWGVMTTMAGGNNNNDKGHDDKQ